MMIEPQKTCRACGTIFLRGRDAGLKWQKRKYCSPACASSCKPSRPPEDRFWEKVDRRGPDDCWMWQGGLAGNGYGSFNANRRYVAAHRFALKTTGVEVRPHAIVMHKCDQPLCCNPAHLSIGSHQANSDDKWRKGRQPTKLTLDQVHEIRSSTETAKALAARLGVARSHVSNIRAGRNWPTPAPAVRPPVHGGM